MTTHRQTAISRTTRVLCLLAALLVALRPALAAEAFKFLHLSDTHVCNLDRVPAAFAKVRKVNRVSLAALPKFLKTRPRQVGAKAVVITGDLIDFYATQSPGGPPIADQLPLFARIAKSSPVPLWLTLGNHDIGNMMLNEAGLRGTTSRHQAVQARAEWVRTVDCFRNGTYYQLQQQVGSAKYRLVFLDNDFPVNAGDRNEILDRYQIDWLQYALRHSDREPVILFMHEPLPASGRGALRGTNVERLLRVIDEHPSVVAVFAGHRHQNVIEECELPSGRRIVQVLTGSFPAAPDNWRTVTLHPQAISVSSPGGGHEEKAIQLATP